MGLVALAAVYGLLQAVVSLPAAKRLARDRIAAAVRERLPDASVGEAHVDPLFRVSFGPVAAARGGATLSVERVRARPSLAALLRGRVAPASVRLHGARVSVPLAGRDVELGPADVLLRDGGSGETRTLRAELTLPAGGTGTVEARREGGAWRIEGRLRGVEAEALPRALRDGAAALASGSLSLDVDARVPADLSTAEATFSAGTHEVFVAGERVAPAPIGPLDATVRGSLSWDGAARRIALREGSVSLAGGPAILVEGEARLAGELPFTVTLRAPGIDFEALVAALPPPLAPPPEAPRARGPLTAHLAASGPLLAPERWSFQASLDLARMRASARSEAPVALRRPFVHRADVGAGRARRFEVGPRNLEYVPIAELPEHVVRAVTTSEDAGFFAHPGFDFAELAEAFTRGAERGRVVRGGSTITQQVAKNLYLSGERTLARKVREAAIAIALEATLSKQRILEIYLNVAEWGPGVFGIGPAARHWFGKDARALTPKEAAFLASIIPNPLRHEAQHARGGPSAALEARVQDLLFKMTLHGALTGDDLVRALEEPIVFAGG